MVTQGWNSDVMRPRMAKGCAQKKDPGMENRNALGTTNGVNNKDGTGIKLLQELMALEAEGEGVAANCYLFHQ